MTIRFVNAQNANYGVTAMNGSVLVTINVPFQMIVNAPMSAKEAREFAAELVKAADFLDKAEP